MRVQTLQIGHADKESRMIHKLYTAVHSDALSQRYQSKLLRICK